MSASQETQMEGVETALMNEDEKRVLEIYDRLEALQLEIALLRAQGVFSQGILYKASLILSNSHHLDSQRSEHYLQHQVQDDIANAEKALLVSKATYQVRNNVIEQTLIANPIVKAVHGSTNATVAEQYV